MTGRPPPFGFIHGHYRNNHPSGYDLSYGFPPPVYPPQQDSEHVPPPSTSLESSSSSSDDDEKSHPRLDLSFQDDIIGGCWQHCNVDGPFPANMVRAGVDCDGSVIYAGRAFHEGEMIPAKVIPSKNACFIAYGGEEIPKEDFEVLRQGDFVWEFAANGVVPEGAVKMGATVDGEPLYMGRALYSGSQTPGKVHSSHGCLYIPFEGAEISHSEYEVLCIK
ncbi:natterin-4-like [Armigeres subalbatus]|uniref:natterin-4-like n=1 Tax=Armigeres subalbatus TaxID=124917 RepID=UPI002ED1EFC9